MKQAKFEKRGLKEEKYTNKKWIIEIKVKKESLKKRF
jgi:hypothetical protein